MLLPRCLTHVLALRSQCLSSSFALSLTCAPRGTEGLVSSLQSPAFLGCLCVGHSGFTFPRCPVSLLILSVSQSPLSVKFSWAVVFSLSFALLLCSPLCRTLTQTPFLASCLPFPFFAAFFNRLFFFHSFSSLDYAPALLWCPLLIFT